MKSKFVVICYYMAEEAIYRSDQFLENNYDVSEYTEVFGYPRSELISDTMPGIAQEIYHLTMQTAWVERFKRPLQFGDALICDGKVAIYVPGEDLDLFRAAGWQYEPAGLFAPAPCTPQYGLVYLPDAPQFVEHFNAK